MKKLFLAVALSMFFSFSLFAEYLSCDFSSLAPFESLKLDSSAGKITLKVKSGEFSSSTKECRIAGYGEDGINGTIYKARCDDFRIKVQILGPSHMGNVYIFDDYGSEDEWSIQCD